MNAHDECIFAGLRPGGYGAIVADPPWDFRSRTPLTDENRHLRRDAEKHYEVMSLKEIRALPVQDLASQSGCHLFLWTTGPFLPYAIDILSGWGFKYSGLGFVWVKLKRSIDPTQRRLVTSFDHLFHMGLGHTTRANAEVCLLGRRGTARRAARNVRQLIVAPVREHSRKPDETYPRVEAYCAGPYVELFARQRRPGWDAWGREADKFTNAA